jgi:hypothetical protein
LGLCAVGARSTASGVGKGADAAKYSVQATDAAASNITAAEKALTAAKSTKDSAKIAEAEKALAAAKTESGKMAAAQQAQVKAQVAFMTKSQRKTIQETVGKKYNTNALTPEQLPKTIDGARGDLTAANQNVTVARSSLNNIDKTKNPEAYKSAEGTVREAETAAAMQANEVHSLLQYQRIAQIDGMTMMGRVQHYGSTTWDGLMASGKTIFNKNLTNPYTGEVRTLYSSTPRSASEAAASNANPGFFSRMFGSNKGKTVNSADETAGGLSANSNGKTLSSSTDEVTSVASKGAVSEGKVPPKQTVSTPETPTVGGRTDTSTKNVNDDSANPAVNVVQTSKDIKGQAAGAVTKADAEKAHVAAQELLLNAKTKDELVAATEALKATEQALQQFKQPSKFAQYGSYLWNHKMASLAQANSAMSPALQMVGIGGSGQEGGNIFGGLGGLVG